MVTKLKKKQSLSFWRDGFNEIEDLKINHTMYDSLGKDEKTEFQISEEELKK